MKISSNAFKIFIFLMLFVATYSLSKITVNAMTTPALVDTTRYFPKPHNFPQLEGWQITNKKTNLATRQFESQTVMGYRYIVDKGTAPRTALSFQVVVTKLRGGSFSDPKTGMTISRANYVYQNQFKLCREDFLRAAKPLKFGDQSFDAVRDRDKHLIFIRRGDFLIDIRGADTMPSYKSKPKVKDVAFFLAEFIDSRIFGARIGLVRPIQVFNNPKIQMVAGKKMVVYVSVETEKNQPFPENYLLKVKVGERGFKKQAYAIPLGSKEKTEFDPVTNDTDGPVWDKEYGEQTPITRTERACFRLKKEREYDTRLYRFFLDPVDPQFYGDYVFRVTIENPESGSKLRETVVKMPTRPSKSFKIAIMPIPVGYWTPAEHWDVEDWAWISKLGDQGWKRKSFIYFTAPLPEHVQMKYRMYPRVKKYLRKHLITSKGQKRYQEKITDSRQFLKAVFPLAEENFEIYTYDDFPRDIEVEPHPDSPEKILKALKKWHSKHPRFQRVIGVVPGGNPMKGGVKFYLDDATGQNLWLKKKYILLNVNAKDFQLAHEVAQSLGAADEWTPPAAKKKTGWNRPMNSPVGEPGGQVVVNGYWVQQKKFMGTPIKPINSIMGKIKPAWIPENVYKGLRKTAEGGI